MDKLLTFSGGQPLTTGDLDFLQQCYTNALVALARGILNRGDNTARYCILYGIRQAGTSDITTGAVLNFTGEIFFVNKTLSRTTEKYLCFRRREEDERVFADSSTHAVRLVHEAYVTDTLDATDIITGATFVIDGMPTLADVLAGNNDVWQELQAEFPEGSSGKVEYNRLTDTYRVQVKHPSTTGGTGLFTIDSELYPGVYWGIAVNNRFKPYVVWMGNGNCSVYNIDGTMIGTDEEIIFNKAILNRY